MEDSTSESFLTNSRELQQRIDRAEGIQSANSEAHGSEHSSHLDETYAQAVLGTLPTKGVEEHKILGVPWNPSSDCLIFSVSELAQVANNLQPTKRNLVGLIGKFYDPLGFLAPTTIRFKILFQKLCQAKIEWDDPLPEGLVQEWKELVADLSEGGPTSIPRSYFHHVGGSPRLCFVDFATPPREPMQQ